MAPMLNYPCQSSDTIQISTIELVINESRKIEYYLEGKVKTTLFKKEMKDILASLLLEMIQQKMKK